MGRADLEVRRVRVYYPFFPFPTTAGGRWLVAEQLRALASLGMEVELVTWLDPPERIREAAPTAVPRELYGALSVRHLGNPELGARPVDAWAEEYANQEIETPPADRHRGDESPGSRIRRVARALVSPYASPELFHYPPALDLREGLPPADLGIYQYTFAYPWLTSGRPAPERRTAIHVQNLESRVAEARARTARGASRLLHRRNARLLARHERALGGVVDELWFVSRADLEDWRSHAPSEGLRFVPPTVPDLRHRTPLSEQSRGTVLGFIGTLDFEPNLRGVEWLVRVLAPKLARLDRPARIVVAGRGLPASLRNEGERWGFFDFRGFVDDLETFWTGIDALLVPDLHGIGVRVKLLEAVARGLPVLTHPTAASALAPDVAESPLLTVADEPDRWVEVIAELESRLPEPGRPRSLEGREVYAFLEGEA